MATSSQIAKVSPRHDQIIAYLIANPTMKKGDIARHFNVTPAWLSTIIHSDIFQAKLAERQQEFFSVATAPIAEKLEALADLAIDELTDRVEVENDTAEVREIAKLALERLGYSKGTQAPGAIVQNNFNLTLSPAQLAAAREKIINRPQGDPLVPEGETALLPATPEEL
jgi:hypothetical protein